MNKKAGKKGFGLAEILIAVIILGILAAIMIPRFTEPSENWREIPAGLGTDVWVYLRDASPNYSQEARLLYGVENRWNYSSVQFKDISLDGGLNQVFCKKGIGVKLTFDPNTPQEEYPEGESWEVWLGRFSKVRREAATGLKPNAEEIL